MQSTDSSCDVHRWGHAAWVWGTCKTAAREPVFSVAARPRLLPFCRARDRWAAAAERRQRLDAELSELLLAAAGVEAMAAELQRDTAVMQRVRSAALSCVGPSADVRLNEAMAARGCDGKQIGLPGLHRTASFGARSRV